MHDQSRPAWLLDGSLLLQINIQQLCVCGSG